MRENLPGFLPQERREICRLLDRVFCVLAVTMESNLLLCWLNRGGRLAEQYNLKRDVTWKQYNNLGTRIARLGGNPTLNPIRQYQKAEMRYQKLERNVQGLIKQDLAAETDLLSVMRSHSSQLRRLDDWVGVITLASHIREREELVADIVALLEQEQRVELLWDQEALEMQRWNPIH